VETDGGTVKITIEPVDDVELTGKDLPKIRGATQQKMVDFVATFEKICLAEGVFVLSLLLYLFFLYSIFND
jgi:hypothetical protein